MFSIKKPTNIGVKFQGALKKNLLGVTQNSYVGAPSSLCAGCGHDSITAAIIAACFESSIPAWQVAKLSGIGCSSKTPAYFLPEAHGFNAVHGRMPSIATGACLANNSMYYLGVSGDGDTGSIGLGQFAHAMRRQVPLLYILENNGVYGLTKGQFSATADKGSLSAKSAKLAKAKKSTAKLDANPFSAIDPVLLAMDLGATFVARSFSGDKEQLVPLIQAAMQHKGFALIDIISPCVSFNNHADSTKSYTYVREHEQHWTAVDDFIPKAASVDAQYAAGSKLDLRLQDGSYLCLQKTAADHDPCDKDKAREFVRACAAEGAIATGLFYIDTEAEDLHSLLGTPARPLRDFTFAELSPGSAALEKLQAGLR